MATIPTMRILPVDPEVLKEDRPFHTIVRLPEAERNYMLLMMSMASAVDDEGNPLAENTAHQIMMVLRRMSLFLNHYDEYVKDHPDACCLPEEGLEAIYIDAAVEVAKNG